MHGSFLLGWVRHSATLKEERIDLSTNDGDLDLGLNIFLDMKEYPYLFGLGNTGVRMCGSDHQREGQGIGKNLTNRLELLFLTVHALPNASRIGVALISLSCMELVVELEMEAKNWRIALVLWVLPDPD